MGVRGRGNGETIWSAKKGIGRCREVDAVGATEDLELWYSPIQFALVLALWDLARWKMGCGLRHTGKLDRCRLRLHGGLIVGLVRTRRRRSISRASRMVQRRWPRPRTRRPTSMP